MKSWNILLLILLSIGVIGFVLRLVDYDHVPPFGDTQDEFSYPWAGMTFLQTGVPLAWSWFPAYPTRNVVTKWGINYPLVSPWLEKPPLYPLIMGWWVLLNQTRSLFDVRLTTIRIIPIVISIFTIVFTGILAKKVFSFQHAVISSLLYAIVPTIILANRLSLTENLLTPLALLTVILFLTESKIKQWHIWQPVLIGIASGLVILTKNIGIVAGVVMIVLFLLKNNWKGAVIIGAICTLFALVHPAIGYYYDWQLYLGVMGDYQREFANSGPPELIATMFLYPTISSKDHVFLDGSMLLGYLLFFTSPLWLFKRNVENTSGLLSARIKQFIFPLRGQSEATTLNQEKETALLAFPFAYLTLLTALASGAKFSFYGWHLYPLFPFLMILLAHILIQLWKSPAFYQILSVFLFLGSSTIRFVFRFLPETITYRWQTVFMLTLFLIMANSLLPKMKQRYLLAGLFVIYLLVNVYTALHLGQIYPSTPQPLN